MRYYYYAVGESFSSTLRECLDELQPLPSRAIALVSAMQSICLGHFRHIAAAIYQRIPTPCANRMDEDTL